jgi:hypothetical protein
MTAIFRIAHLWDVASDEVRIPAEPAAREYDRLAADASIVPSGRRAPTATTRPRSSA